MTARIEPSLGPLARNAPPGILGSAEPALARAGVARASPFLVEGERMAVTGTERAGAHVFWLGDLRVAEALATDAGPAANVVVAPTSLRRELLGPRGSLLELTFVAPALPLAAVQWQAPSGGEGPGAMSLALVLLPGAAEVRYHAEGEGLRCLAGAGEGEAAVEMRVHPAPHEWRVREVEGGGIRVAARVAGGGPVTLLLAAGTRHEAARAMAAAPHLAAHEARAAADADPATAESLAAATGALEVDGALLWATLRTRLGLLRGGGGPPEEVFWAGLGALAVGDVQAGEAALEGLRRRGDEPVAVRLGVPVSAQALAVLLAARLTLLSGNPEAALGAWRLSSPQILGVSRAISQAQAPALWSLALRTLADALRFAAGEDAIGALRREAAALDRIVPRTLRLPMAGHPRPSGGDGALRRLLGAEGASPELVEADTPLGAWATWSSAEPELAWRAWRALLARGLDHGPAGRGTWDAGERPPGAAPQAGLLLCGLAHGFLGLAPDAPSGRIRIAPAVPSRLSAFRARGIRAGDARIELVYQREGRLHTLRLEPTHGRVPLTCVLEPSLPAAEIETVRVDGKPACLEAVTLGTRVRLRVQIVLDAPRAVEVEVPP